MKVNVDLVAGGAVSTKRTVTVDVEDGLQGLKLMNAAKEAVEDQIRPGESIADVVVE